MSSNAGDSNTENRKSNFPALSLKEGDIVFMYIAGFRDRSVFKGKVSGFTISPKGNLPRIKILGEKSWWTNNRPLLPGEYTIIAKENNEKK